LAPFPPGAGDGAERTSGDVGDWPRRLAPIVVVGQNWPRRLLNHSNI